MKKGGAASQHPQEESRVKVLMAPEQSCLKYCLLQAKMIFLFIYLLSFYLIIYLVGVSHGTSQRAAVCCTGRCGLVIV